MSMEPAYSPIGTVHNFEPLTHNAGNLATGGIWRVSGEAGTAILKHSTPPGGEEDSRWAAGAEPTHWNYWRREASCYGSGFADHYLDGVAIRPPRLLAEGERDDGSIEIWLEDVAAEREWTPESLGEFSRGLGRVQARAAAATGPQWLSRGWLRQYSGRMGPPSAVDWEHPDVVRAWPARLRADLARLWESRHRLYDLAEAAPGTICHLDVWPMNLLAEADGAVLLDWSFIGYGAVGEDIGNLIPDCVADGLMAPELLPDIADACTAGYLAGLAEAGFTGSGDEVRRSVAICGAAKYAWLAPVMMSRLARGLTIGSTHYDQGGDNVAILVRRRSMMELLANWARRALEH